MNVHKGELTFSVEGKDYVLAFDHEALIQLEEKLDKGIVRIMKEVSEWSEDPESLRLGTVRTMLWAGLHKYQPALTLPEATELIGKIDGGIVKVVELIGDGFNRAFAAPGTKGTNPPQRAANGTGMTPGSTSSAMDTIPNPSGTLPHAS